MLREQIQNDLKAAMLAKEEIKVSTLRLLMAAIRNKEIAQSGASDVNLIDEEVIGVIAKQAKERRESIEAFRGAGREELAGKEEAELVILNQYLPQQLGEEELEKIVSETITELGASSPADFGRVMKTVMEKVRGQADGNAVSGLVRKLLG